MSLPILIGRGLDQKERRCCIRFAVLRVYVKEHSGGVLFFVPKYLRGMIA